MSRCSRPTPLLPPTQPLLVVNNHLYGKRKSCLGIVPLDIDFRGGKEWPNLVRCVREEFDDWVECLMKRINRPDVCSLTRKLDSVRVDLCTFIMLLHPVVV